MGDSITKFLESEQSLLSGVQPRIILSKQDKPPNYYSYQNNTLDDRIQINYKWQKRKNSLK